MAQNDLVTSFYSILSADLALVDACTTLGTRAPPNTNTFPRPNRGPMEKTVLTKNK